MKLEYDPDLNRVYFTFIFLKEILKHSILVTNVCVFCTIAILFLGKKTKNRPKKAVLQLRFPRSCHSRHVFGCKWDFWSQNLQRLEILRGIIGSWHQFLHPHVVKNSWNMVQTRQSGYLEDHPRTFSRKRLTSMVWLISPLRITLWDPPWNGL